VAATTVVVTAAVGSTIDLFTKQLLDRIIFFGPKVAFLFWRHRMYSLLMLLALSASPPESPPAMDFDKLDQLVVIRSIFDSMENFKNDGVDADSDGKIKAQLLANASEIVGQPVKSYEELKALTGGSARPPTPWERVKGWFTFLNVILITAAILFVVAIVALFGHYLIDLIRAVPLPAWEVICYGFCAVLIGLGDKVPADFTLMVTLPGVLGLVGCLALTKYAHFKDNKTIQPYLWFLTLAWGAVAIMDGSHVIGFFAVMALMSALGFVCGMIPGVVYVGFEDEKVAPRATSSAFLILAFYTLVHITGTTNQYIDVFKTGAQFMGSFVYFLGILCMSSKWWSWTSYKQTRLDTYLAMQVLAIASGLAALFIGNVYGMGFLLGIGGTLFYLYVLEKYYEIPWKGIGWAWSLLGLAGMLYFGVAFAKLHPEYFLFIG